MKFTWIGGATFLLEIGPFRILGDPVFADAFDMDAGSGGVHVTRTTPLPDTDTSRLDLVCATSFRGDHFDPGAAARLGGDAPLVAPDATGVDHGFREVRAMGWGDSFEVAKGDDTLRVHAVPAAAGNGYYFRHEAAGATSTVYWTGDVLWSDAIRSIQREHGYANLLIQHIGAEPGLSPGGKEAMQIVYRMQPNAVVAVHHHTFSHYAEPIAPFVELIGRTIYEKRLRVLSEGESFEK